MHVIVYVSCATRYVDEETLENLLMSCRTNNKKHGVTGVLLHHDSNFLQYIEGDKHELELVYNHIKSSTLHRNVFELLNEPITERKFSDWNMGYTTAPETLIMDLEQANWTAIAQDLQANKDKSDGISLLLNFWKHSNEI